MVENGPPEPVLKPTPNDHQTVRNIPNPAANQLLRRPIATNPSMMRHSSVDKTPCATA
jgi:hypothetical protein